MLLLNARECLPGYLAQDACPRLTNFDDEQTRVRKFQRVCESFEMSDAWKRKCGSPTRACDPSFPKHVPQNAILYGVARRGGTTHLWETCRRELHYTDRVVLKETTS